METRSQTRRRAILEWLRDFVRSAREPTTEDFLFASQIDTETLNQVIEEGPNKGKPVAFFLTGSPEGQAILARNNYLPDYLEKHQMIILCRLILLASVKKKVQTIILIEK